MKQPTLNALRSTLWFGLDFILYGGALAVFFLAPYIAGAAS